MGGKHNGSTTIDASHYERPKACVVGIFISLSLPLYISFCSIHARVRAFVTAHTHTHASNRYPFVSTIGPRERETERNTMANGILLFQIGPARISPSLLTGSEECRHEIILQYLTVGLFPLCLPLALPTPQRSNNHRVRNPKVNPNHWHPPRRAIRPCLRRSFITLV